MKAQIFKVSLRGGIISMCRQSSRRFVHTRDLVETLFADKSWK